MAENKVKQAEAEAKIKIATAEGNAQALLTNAKAEAESNRLRQQTITPLLLQQMWIEKWKGNVPNTVLGSNQNLMFGLNK
jgi:regulator of protease activity HflC (stomatin/prohibitin superfamily)